MKTLLLFIGFVFMNSSCDYVDFQQDEPVNDSKFTVLNISDKPVRISLISDLQCQSCKIFYEESFADIKAAYIVTGKVTFLSEVIPFVGPQASAKAAILKVVANVSAENYLQAYEKAFEEDVFNGDASYYARAIVRSGLYSGTSKQLENNSKKPEVMQEISRVKKQLIGSGIRNVPAILINGKPATSRNTEGLISEIKEALNQ